MKLVYQTNKFLFRVPSKNTKTMGFLNKGVKTTFLALKDGVSFYSSVDQVIQVLERRQTRAIVKVERTEKKLIEAIKASPHLGNRVRKNILFLNTNTGLKLETKGSRITNYLLVIAF